jgi:hypothetical protein
MPASRFSGLRIQREDAAITLLIVFLVVIIVFVVPPVE